MKYIVSILLIFTPPAAMFYFASPTAGFITAMVLLAMSVSTSVWLAVHAKAALDVIKQYRESTDDISDRADELNRVAGECLTIAKSTIVASRRARLSPRDNSRRVH